MRNQSKFLTIVAAAGIATAALTLSHASAQQPAQQPTPKPAQPAQPMPAKPARPTFDVGMPAPPFRLVNTADESVQLANYIDSIVVIEWIHPGCEETRYVHTKGPLPSLMKAYEHDDIVWLTINALPATDKFGGIQASLAAEEQLDLASPILVDDSGAVAKLYQVTRAPSFTVIDTEGVVRYMGAIDNAPNGILPKGATLSNHLDLALRAVVDGTEVKTTRTTPAGCELRPAPVKPGN